MKIASIFLLATCCFAQHQIQLTSSNRECKNDTSCNNGLANCICTLQVFRASCNGSVSSCPAVGAAGYTLLPNTVTTAAVSVSGTAWTVNDLDSVLVDGSVWSYYEVAKWGSPNTLPSSDPTGAAIISIPGNIPTPHSATLNYTNSGCVTGKDCWIQLYRAVCSTVSSCPTYTPGNSAFTQLSSTLQFPVWSVTSTGTTWQIVDTDPALTNGTPYVYVSTVCWEPACAAYSPASAPWIGTTSGIISRSMKVKK